MRSAMGTPGSSECLQELTSHVLRDLIQEGFVIVIAVDLHVCCNTVPETFHNWSLVLHRMDENNLKLSAIKTIICVKKTTILGKVWNSGTLSVSQYKTSPLCTAAPPKTCTSMRSYIGAYKAMSCCIPRYPSLLSPLEDSIKGLQGSQQIVWSSELLTHFK